MADITDLLERWSAGDRAAFDEMVPLVYDELKGVSRRALGQERHSRTLDCTALVHEAYLRLTDQSRMQWGGRAHFFGAAAQVMRRILVDHARKRLTGKRGSGAVHEPLDDSISITLEPDIDIIDLNDAIEELAAADPESARVVELRCFGGLSIEETAEVLNTSASTVTRTWSFARAWLYRRLEERH